MVKKIANLPGNENSDELKRSAYFPTLVYSVQLQDAVSMNKEILAAIYEEHSRDSDGIERSNFKSLGSWHSQNNLHKNPNFQRLTDRIEIAAAEISKDLVYDPSKELKVTTMWSISNPPGSSNRAHIHPGALWSGVYYVHSPEGAGKIEFTDPRTVHLMNGASFKRKTQRKSECWTKVKVQPTAGKMLFFPSWLYHSVEPNLAEGTGRESDRVIVSFNINQVPRKK